MNTEILVVLAVVAVIGIVAYKTIGTPEKKEVPPQQPGTGLSFGINFSKLDGVPAR